MFCHELGICAALYTGLEAILTYKGEFRGKVSVSKKHFCGIGKWERQPYSGPDALGSSIPPLGLEGSNTVEKARFYHIIVFENITFIIS